MPEGVESWLKCFFWLLGGVAAVVHLKNQLMPKRVPTIEAEFVTKADLEKFCQARHAPMGETLSDIMAQLKQAERNRADADVRHEERAKLIHGRINRLVPVIYTMAGTMKISVPLDPEEG